MGYTTDFSGEFRLNKELTPTLNTFLTKFNETRRMMRSLDEAKYGEDGEFYVDGGGSYGQSHEDDIVDYNRAPSTQPGLWCQWTPTDDGMGIEWDGGEKFYSYCEWLVYLIDKVLAPNGYVLNGTVEYRGEDFGDVGDIIVTDNNVTLHPYKNEVIHYKHDLEPTHVWIDKEEIEEAVIVEDEVDPTGLDEDGRFMYDVMGMIQGGMSDKAAEALEKKVKEKLAQLK